MVEAPFLFTGQADMLFLPVVVYYELAGPSY
jgi:hypothetical protein